MKKKIALVTGGFTGEFPVSLKSSETVIKNLDHQKYDLYKIIITKESWYYTDDQGAKLEINRHDFSLNLQGETIRFDAVFICLHGSPGEDGKLQGYFEMLDIPYTTCDSVTSALTMNKAYTKAVVADIDHLNLARSIQLFSNDPEKIGFIQQELTLPYFVKTNQGGSSIGMSKVKTARELPEALAKAFQEDSQVLVEEFIEGREFSIGVYKGRQGITVLPATEVIPSREFFDYDAKYTAGLTEEITPGRMSEEEQRRVTGIVKQVYEKLNCRGVVRIDYFLQKETGKFYFIEINTVPGQTEQSFIPQQVRATGQKLGDFYGELIEVVLKP
ncbi:D-alanine--D-alanine ligase [soil metagenome]